MRSIWQRHNLENFRKRLKALEEKVAREGIVLTDAQIAALEKKALDDEACGEIETAHPGYLGSQDTFYVGNLKGVGRIYLQEFYQVTFRKKLYADLESLQMDLDNWLWHYNNERTHQGKMCCGRTPMTTLLDGKRVWAEKNLNQI